MHERCSDCGKYKRNPGDENLRRLERTALSGDIHAARKLSLEKHRRRLCEDGEDCWQCQVKKMQNSDSYVRNQSIWALGSISDPAAIPGLVERMQKDSEWEVRWWAAEVLGKLGDPAAIPSLVGTMQNDYSSLN